MLSQVFRRGGRPGAPGTRLQTDHSSAVMLSGVASIFLLATESKHLRFVSQLHARYTHQRRQSIVVSSLELRQEQPQIPFDYTQGRLSTLSATRRSLRMTVLGWDLCFPRSPAAADETWESKKLNQPARVNQFSRSKIPAAPIPPPTHIVTMP